MSDQWLDPFVIVGEDNNPVGTVQDGEHTNRHLSCLCCCPCMDGAVCAAA